MKNKIKVGMGQLLVEGGEPKRNLERAQLMIEEASKKNCDFILLPECLDLGWTHPSLKTEALTIPGLYSNKICEHAEKFNIYVCAGLTEKEDYKIYNSAILVDPNGKIILKYRKINILSKALEYYSIGTKLSVVNTPFGIFGVNICSDNYSDSLEIGHVLARMGAQIIFSPSSWTVDYNATEENDPYGEKWLGPFKTLASLYNLIIISTTSVGYLVGGPFEGRKMVGCSMAVNRKGIILKGSFNEFAGELTVVETEIPQRIEKGTQIGEMLKNKHYY